MRPWVRGGGISSKLCRVGVALELEDMLHNMSSVLACVLNLEGNRATFARAQST